METVHSQTIAQRAPRPRIDPLAPAGDGRVMQTHYNILAGGEVGRIAALSDGLFAIAATILVLDFHTPESADIHTEAELLHALAASAPRLLPWLLSLLTLGIFWLGQQTQLNQLERSNRDVTWLHFLFLTIVTVLPFSTRLLGDFLTYRTAFLIYWVNILLLGACLYATWSCAEQAKLVREEAHGEISRAVKQRIVVAQSLYALGALAGLLNVTLGITLILLIQLNYAIGPRLPVLSRL
jgi:TMEM175 potassium channel family protein